MRTRYSDENGDPSTDDILFQNLYGLDQVMITCYCNIDQVEVGVIIFFRITAMMTRKFYTIKTSEQKFAYHHFKLLNGND